MKFLSIFILFTQFLLASHCIQLLSMKSFNKNSINERIFNVINNYKKSRVEKKGNYYLLRVGDFSSSKSAKKSYRKLKKIFKKAVIRKCDLTSENLVFVSNDLENMMNKNNEISKKNNYTIIKPKKKVINKPNKPKKTKKLDYTLLKFDNTHFTEDRFITLKNMGYKKKIILEGSYPSYDFIIPILREQKRIDVSFFMQFSQVLNPKSTLTILVDDVPISTNYIEKIDYLPKISFSRQLNPLHKNVKITLRLNMFITGDFCVDNNSKNLWATIERSSGFRVDVPKNIKHISEFFKDYTKDINIIDHSNSPDVVSLVYFLNKLNSTNHLETKYSLIKDRENKNVVIIDDTDEIKLQDNTLYISSKSLQSLNSQWSTLFATSVLKDTKIVKVKNDKKGKKRVSLEDFNIRSITQKGLGELYFNIPFNTRDFGGKIKDMIFYLHFNHTPVTTKERGYLNIFFNNQLIKSFLLDDKTKIKSYPIKIPNSFIKSGVNKFVVNTSFYVSGATCTGSQPKLEATLFDSSYFSWVVENPKINSISNFLDNLSGDVLMVVEDEFKHSAMKFAEKLGKINKSITNLEIIPSLRDLNQDDDNNYDSIIIFAKQDSFKQNEWNLPLIVGENHFSIYNPSNKNLLFSSKNWDDFSFIQTGWFEDTPILTISYFKNEGALNFFNDTEMSQFDEINSNLAFITQNEIVSYQTNRKLRSTDDRISDNFWDKYKLPLLLIFSFMTMIVFVYNYKKLSGQKYE